MLYQVDCSVFPAVREFFIRQNKGSHIIEVSKGDYIRSLLKTLLTEPPTGFRPSDQSKVLTFNLTRFHADIPDVRKCNFLTNDAQRIINKELDKIFKSIFHNYVLAFCRGGGYPTAAIYDFCDIYNLSLDIINFDMLKKSWDRSEQKKIWLREKKVKKLCHIPSFK